MKNLNYILLVILFATQVAQAQKPVPAAPQTKAIALVGGTAHLGTGKIITNALITFDKGKLTNVLDATVVKMDLSEYEVINVNGKHIYPGFILPNSQVGLEEVDAIRAMSDSDETGDLNPNIRSLISYNSDSEYPPTFRFNGVLLAETTPKGGTISGSSSLMEMEGWNWEDAVHTPDIGIHLNWPKRLTRQFNASTFSSTKVPNPQYDARVSALEDFFKDAISYGKQTNKEVNLKLAAMQGLFDGSQILFIHAQDPKEIVSSIRSAKNHGIKKKYLLSQEQVLIG